MRISGQFKTQAMSEKAVENIFLYFLCVPEQFKTPEVCENVIREHRYMMFYAIQDVFKTQGICEEKFDHTMKVTGISD